VGDAVSRVKVGDRVAGIFHQKWLGGEMQDAFSNSALGGDIDGVLTEYKLFDEQGLVHLPAHLSFEEAATLPCAAVTAWHALFHSAKPVKPGDVVLTLGTGGVSVFAIQFAHAAGARVIATSSSDDKLKRAKALGATDGVNYKQTPQWDEAVMQLTDGTGVGHVVDVGGPGTLPLSLNSVKRGGIVHVIGLLAGAGGQINPLVLIPKSASLNGLSVGSREMFEVMNRAIEVHRIKPAIDRVFPFEQAKAAYEHLKSGSHFGKVVIRI
jgi:NADPH:quinone reductase-like Zn-dependent oxidoreductase